MQTVAGYNNSNNSNNSNSSNNSNTDKKRDREIPAGFYRLSIDH